MGDGAKVGTRFDPPILEFENGDPGEVCSELSCLGLQHPPQSSRPQNHCPDARTGHDRRKTPGEELKSFAILTGTEQKCSHSWTDLLATSAPGGTRATGWKGVKGKDDTLGTQAGRL